MPQNMGSCKYFFNFKDVIRLKGFWKGSVFTIAISLYNLSALAESESDVEDVIARKRPQRKFKNIPLNLRSPFWNEHGMKIRNVTVPDKLLSNYAFVEVSDEHPKDELLFSFGDIEITRDHFILLSVGQVENIFLDVWALRLSMLDKERAPGQSKRVFFSTIAYMQSSVSSCSAANSPSLPEYECHGMDYDDYVQLIIGTNSYAPGYAPLAPASSPVAVSFPYVQDGPDVQASYGFYPLEVLTGSDPLEFIVYYPYPWNPGSPEYCDEWSMVNTTSRFLNHFTWFEGEWHLVWGEFTGPVYRRID